MHLETLRSVKKSFTHFWHHHNNILYREVEDNASVGTGFAYPRRNGTIPIELRLKTKKSMLANSETELARTHITNVSYGKDSSRTHLVSSPTGQHFIHHHVGAGSAHYSSHDEPIPVVHEDHYYHIPTNHDEDDHWSIESNQKGRSELTIKDFFEIALTALAFLAFGLFVIQLLMAITNASTATVMTDGVRFRRDIAPSPYNSNFELNELSHRVLQSIEAAMIVETPPTDCLEWSLCRDNRHSKNTNTAQRIWIPVWSLGMSWVSSRISKQPMWSALTASIKASIFGLGGANCDVVYPNCYLIRERRKRHRRWNK